MSRAETADVVAAVAAQLGETEEQPRAQIARAVEILGTERVQTVLAQALEVERQGGLLIGDGSRRRTPGGVFFNLLRKGLIWKQAVYIFPQLGPRTPHAEEQVASAAPFSWEECAALAATVMDEAGEATTVKITLIGRPGRVQERGELILLGLTSTTAPSLPKGVPAPRAPQQAYLVLLSAKQWRTVARALQDDPGDKLIVDGYPTVHPGFAGITVHATSATTTRIQAGKRAAQGQPAVQTPAAAPRPE